MSNDFQIGKEIGELNIRVKNLERKNSCGCSGNKNTKNSKITTQKDIKKVQEFIRKMDLYRRMAEGEENIDLEVPVGYTPAQITCIVSLALTMCGGCILLCGGPEDIPCIAECCGDSWDFIVEACGL